MLQASAASSLKWEATQCQYADELRRAKCTYSSRPCKPNKHSNNITPFIKKYTCPFTVLKLAVYNHHQHFKKLFKLILNLTLNDYDYFKLF